MRRARSNKEGRGEPARGLPEDFAPSAVARGPTGVQTSDGASCDSLARRSSSLFSRGSSVMELSELSSSSRDPDVTGARGARGASAAARPAASSAAWAAAGAAVFAAAPRPGWPRGPWATGSHPPEGAAPSAASAGGSRRPARRP